MQYRPASVSAFVRERHGPSAAEQANVSSIYLTGPGREEVAKKKTLLAGTASEKDCSLKFSLGTRK